MAEREDLAQRLFREIGSESLLQLAFAGPLVHLFW